MSDDIRCFMVVQLASGDVCLGYKCAEDGGGRPRDHENIAALFDQLSGPMQIANAALFDRRENAKLASHAKRPI